jgi:hypothetical protein
MGKFHIILDLEHVQTKSQAESVLKQMHGEDRVISVDQKIPEKPFDHYEEFKGER